MGNFNRDRKTSGDRNFGRRDSGDRDRSRGFDRSDRPMYKAVCSNCGKECEVPFKPTNGKPVYCSDCFENIRRGSRHDSPRFERPDFKSQGIDQNKNQFNALNIKLDRILRILEPRIDAAVIHAEIPQGSETDIELKETKVPKVNKAAKKSISAKKK